MQQFLKLLLFLVCIIGITKYDLNAQNNATVTPTELSFSIFETTVDTLSIHDVIKSHRAFKPSETFLGKSNPSNTYWIKIDLATELETLKNDSLWYLKPHDFGFSYATIFLENNHTIASKVFGKFDTNRLKKHFPGVFFQYNSLIDGRFIFLKLNRIEYFESISRWKFYYTLGKSQTLSNYFVLKKDSSKLIPKYIFIGICFIMIILTLAFFVTSKNIEFLFYSLYVFWLFIYLEDDTLKLGELIFGHNYLTAYWFFDISLPLFNLCYILFSMFYLETKKEYPKLNTAILLLSGILVGFIILDSSFLYFKYFVGSVYMLKFQILIMSFYGICSFAYLLIHAKNHLAYFIVFGALSFMVGGLSSLFLENNMYLIAGATLEIIIFALGLTYKIQQEHKEKLHYQRESYLNNNKALRAQINPHFIFNSLNSIQNLILSSKKESAIKYLSKFSLLMRNLLEGSIENNVVLSEDIKLLKKYLELESLRFDEAFKYTIEIEDNLDPDAVEVPMLIVQPFVENAILYGLLNKNGADKNLNIRFKKEDENIICEVEDDGIGRSASMHMNSILKKTTKSRGVEVTKKRLQLIDQSEEENIEFIDKTNKKGEPMGTKVIIRIPTEYNF